MTAVILTAAAGAVVLADHGHTPFDALFERVGLEQSVDPDLLRAIARRESSFVASAVSPPNANGTRDYGLMQINEATARALGRDAAKLLDPEYNVRTAVELLKRLKQELGSQFDSMTWVAAYNAGSPAIKARGIFNVVYVSGVVFHWLAYTLARQAKGGK